MIEKLRDEIIESEKARTDLLKWKLILVAAVGAASFGLGSNVPAGSNPPIVLLALVPWVCVYVDAVCIHLELRILAIARFVRLGGGGSLAADSVARKYEEYCAERRPGFSLEGFALVMTTIGLSFLVFIIGFTSPRIFIPMPAPLEPFALTVLKMSGGLGIAGSLGLYGGYKSRIAELDK